MRNMINIHVVLGFILITVSPCFPAEQSTPKEDQESKYLQAVREFADNVLKYGRDTYGPKHTPLFVDGLDIHTHEPVKWIAPGTMNEEWILSNFASQQNLFRTLDGLTTITGDQKYRHAAVEAITYMFANLRGPNGLFYWGMGYAYDASADKVCGDVCNHSLRYNYPYYGLMWRVSPNETRDYVESFWAAHILDWSSLDMLRYAPLDSYKVAKGWDHEYEGGIVPFMGKDGCHFGPGSSLFYAAAIVSGISGKKDPLIWAKRLAHRYVETRNPNTHISSLTYSIGEADPSEYVFGDDFRGHTIRYGAMIPDYPKFYAEPEALAFPMRGWMCMLMLGDVLRDNGVEFKRWALEELTAWGKVAYHPEDNSLIPILTDGTSLEGYVLKRDGYYGAKGTIFKSRHPQGLEFWAYSMAYRITGDQFMQEMVQNIGKGNNFGDIGAVVDSERKLNLGTDCTDPYALFGFLELYRKTGRNAFMEMASRIGDNIINHRLCNGFFVPSKKHTYTRFDNLEHLALLHLFAVITSKTASVPTAWPGESCFACNYRDRNDTYDVDLIYTLTDLSQPPISLHEAASMGNLKLIKSLISEGAEIDGRERSMWTPLHRAAINDNKQAVELLLAEGANVNAANAFGASVLHTVAEKGYKEIAGLLIEKEADVSAKDMSGFTPLHYAVKDGHEDVVELLLAHGANVNVRDKQRKTPIDIAMRKPHMDIASALIDNGAEASLFTKMRVNMARQAKTANLSLLTAAQNGELEKVEALLGQGTDINVRDSEGNTALHYVVRGRHEKLAQFLIKQGADVAVKDVRGMTPLYFAIGNGMDVVAKMLIAHDDIDVNVQTDRGWTPLHMATIQDHKEVVQSLVKHGADINIKNKGGKTPLDFARRGGNVEIIEILTKAAEEQKATKGSTSRSGDH